MHVAFFNRSYYPDTTATGQLLTELCEALVRNYNCRVTVVAGAPLNPSIGTTRLSKGLLFSQEAHDGVAVLRARGTRYSKRRFIGRFSNYVSYFLSACWTGLSVDNPDIVVALTDPPIIGLAAWLAAKRFRAPFVMSYRDIFPEVVRLLEDFQSPLVERILQSVNCFLTQHADRVISLGSTMSRRLIEGKGADPQRVLIIPDWADCQGITPGPKRNPFTEAHGLADRFVVMHSGNIGLSQALETVVDAAALLREHREIVVIFVGDGAKKPSLQQRVESLRLTNVMFLPYTPKQELAQSFAAADLFLVSLREGMAGYIVPSKLYGILAAGRPYVASAEEESEVVQITRRYECGLTAPPGNAPAMAACILELYRDPEMRRRMGENARAAALEFDRNAGVEKYYRLFQELELASGYSKKAGSREKR
ncbi:MAG: glycosyltransferase family 4 protein [Acidobacteriota bacterium]